MVEKSHRSRESWRQPPNDPERDANYQGDFSDLLLKRVQSSAIKEQIIHLIEEKERAEGEKPDREKIARDLRVAIRSAKTYLSYSQGEEPPSMGDIHLNWVTEQGRKMTERELSMVEAHEQGHWIRPYFGESFDNYQHLRRQTIKSLFAILFFLIKQEVRRR